MDLSNIITIQALQQGYLRIQRGESSVHEWCKMHRSYDADSHSTNNNPTDEKRDKGDKPSKISINDLIFPHIGGQEFYQEIARHILTTDTKVESIQSDIIIPDEKDRDCAKQSHQRKATQIIDGLKGNYLWEKVIDKLQKRIDLSDEIVLDRLKTEIDDPLIRCKDLYWLTSWYLRFGFATSNPRWNEWFFEDNVGFYEWSLTIHYTYAYKDKNIFELMLSSLPSKLCQELMSLTVLNNTVMTVLGRVITSRTVPFTVPLSRFDIMELISCGIFPVGIVARTIMEADGCPMGATFSFHDIIHAATYIAPSMVCLRKTPYDETESSRMFLGLTSSWYIYNSYVIKCVELANTENWSDAQKDILFLHVHELMCSAYGSFATILRSPLETGEKLKGYDEKNINFRNKLVRSQRQSYDLEEYVKLSDRMQKIFIKYFLQTVTELSRNNQNCLQLQHEIFLKWISFHHSTSNVLKSEMFVRNFDQTPELSVPVEKQYLTQKLSKDVTKLYGMIVRFIPGYETIKTPQFVTIDDLLLREQPSIYRSGDKTSFFEASLIDN